MGRGKRYQPEQVVNLLQQIEVAVANGKTTAQACKEAEIAERRRCAVSHVCEHGVSERHACLLLSVPPRIPARCQPSEPR
jgi:hypothetical protein